MFEDVSIGSGELTYRKMFFYDNTKHKKVLRKRVHVIWLDPEN